MEEAATRQHAHANTVYHCLYAYFSLGFTLKHLAHVYNKSERTIRNWLQVYQQTGTYQRVTSASERKFTTAQRQWLYDYYDSNPLSYLDEAQTAFKRIHRIDISKTSIWRIIRSFGLTWKVLERRAMHIKESDVFRFAEELSHIDWSHQNLVFLDEVSFDNRGMIRKRGYAIGGKQVAVRGDFVRKPRVSVLAFIGVNGVIDYFDTDGTFDRAEFTKCCMDFVHSERGNGSASVQMYPGRHSVWILDGATIHRHPDIVHYLRSVGVVPIFLPAYCPFFNPIEFMFGYMKRAFQRHYNETSGRDLRPFIAETFQRFEGYAMNKVFEHCGWMVDGVFNPVGPLSSDKRTCPTAPATEDTQEDELGYTQLDSEE
ncbi:hypothetical protein DYB26_013729 [Aphanomyces astaci]|uniref:Tc1-like transposase DDE domain-containing protein n=2 Tax=Aphanomyces astaci TaxID=112090 RepID=A0A397F9U0_APHAT|nr:hypothetical protein DYB31_014589 [Aphanomyces astaci]RHZ39709.1 hypothetical protein DYB26_013729 [Aphanomyces astaci]